MWSERILGHTVMVVSLASSEIRWFGVCKQSVNHEKGFKEISIGVQTDGGAYTNTSQKAYVVVKGKRELLMSWT